MIENILLFIGFYIGSIVFVRRVMWRDKGVFNTPVYMLGFIGVCVHELSHLLMCFATNVPVNGIRVKYRDKYRRANPHGSVRFKERLRITFLQAVVTGLAPLYICTWLCLFFLGVMLDPTVEPILRILFGLLAVSVFIGAAPSSADLQNIPAAFRHNTHYSIRQLGLLAVALVVFFLLQSPLTAFLPEIILALPFIPFLYIMLLYYAVKYVWVGVYSVFKKLLRSRSSGPHGVDITKRSSVDARLPKAYRFTRHDEDGIW